MNNSFLIEVFARVSFSFTRSVAEHYDPHEPEVEIFGCNESLSSEGREWNCQPVDKPIYQEYSPPSDDEYDLRSIGNSRVRYRLINASSPDEDGDEQQDENDEMAWKRFRPSVLRTINVHRRIDFTSIRCHPRPFLRHDRLRLLRNDTQLPISPEGDNPS